MGHHELSLVKSAKWKWVQLGLKIKIIFKLPRCYQQNMLKERRMQVAKRLTDEQIFLCKANEGNVYSEYLFIYASLPQPSMRHGSQ